MIIKAYRRLKKLIWKLSAKKRLSTLYSSLNGQTIVLIGTPEYCNLGDHLIAESAIEFLKDFFRDYKLVEITRELYENSSKPIEKVLENHSADAIFITGGGFLGSLWEQMDDDVIRILSVCQDKPIIILPQTIYYEPASNNRFQIDKSAYEKIDRLKVFVRETRSYSTLIDSGLLRQDKLSLRPDMALYLYPYEFQQRDRNGIALCMRGDKESTLSVDDLGIIRKFAADLELGRITNIETVDKYKSFIPEKRKEELDKFVHIVASKKLVITNRLHCMIFCFLTHTPCIAIDNISHKITGVYEWIKDCEHIRCIDDFSLERLQTAYEEVKDASTSYDGAMLKEEFKAMAAEIKEVLR